MRSRIRCSRVSLSSRRRASLSAAQLRSYGPDQLQRTPPTVPSASRTADRNIEIDGLLHILFARYRTDDPWPRRSFGFRGRGEQRLQIIPKFGPILAGGTAERADHSKPQRVAHHADRGQRVPIQIGHRNNRAAEAISGLRCGRPGGAAPERPGRRGQQDCAANPPLAHMVKTSGKEKVVHASASKAKIRVATVAFCYGFLREPKL